MNIADLAAIARDNVVPLEVESGWQSGRSRAPSVTYLLLSGEAMAYLPSGPIVARNRFDCADEGETTYKCPK